MLNNSFFHKSQCINSTDKKYLEQKEKGGRLYFNRPPEARENPQDRDKPLHYKVGQATTTRHMCSLLGKTGFRLCLL